jgi:hypothetical protein
LSIFKEVPIEFIDEHSEVCSAADNESEYVEEALWVELMDDLEASQFLPQRKKFGKIKKLMRTIGVPGKLRGKVVGGMWGVFRELGVAIVGGNCFEKKF